MMRWQGLQKLLHLPCVFVELVKSGFKLVAEEEQEEQTKERERRPGLARKEDVQCGILRQYYST